MSGTFEVINLAACIRALEQARVEDFARYVGRRLDEEPRLASIPFRDGWNVMLGGYAEMATRNYTNPDD